MKRHLLTAFIALQTLLIAQTRPNQHYLSVGPIAESTQFWDFGREQAVDGVTFSIGNRDSLGQVRIDRQLGLSVGQDFYGAFGQASILYYPLPDAGLYTGIGLLLGVYSHDHYDQVYDLTTHVPLTLGYSFPLSKEHGEQFIQLQLGPQLSTIISYGRPF